MKCIHCSIDNKYKERLANRQKCKGCGHPFAFEPKTDAFQMNDLLFARAIKDVSADGTLAFTPRQLGYEINRRLLARKTLSCGTGVLAMMLGGGLLYEMIRWRYAAPAFMVSGLAMAATTGKKAKTGRKAARYPKMPISKFESDYLPQWIKTHDKIPKLLPSPVPRSEGGKQGKAPDVTAYSFDRALVVDHAETAAMLVANNFHFENNCAILSLDGYPFGTADTIKTMLARNPALKVFALHNASVPGCQMGRTLRGPEWFPDTSVRLIDLGLRPQHVVNGGLIAVANIPTKFPTDVGTSLGAEEIAWLEQGNVAELHALRPAKLMRAVYQGFARANQTDDAVVGSDGFIIVDTGPSVWVHDGGADVYAADSFG